MSDDTGGVDSSTPSSDSGAGETGLTTTKNGQEAGWWIVNAEDVDPFTNLSQESNPFTQLPTSGSSFLGENATGAIALDPSANAYTGGNQIDPFTGQQHVYSSGALAKDVLEDRPGARYVNPTMLAGQTPIDTVSIDGLECLHYRIVLGGTSYDAYWYAQAPAGMALLVPAAESPARNLFQQFAATSSAMKLFQQFAVPPAGVSSGSQPPGSFSLPALSALHSLNSAFSQATSLTLPPTKGSATTGAVLPGSFSFVAFSAIGSLNSSPSQAALNPSLPTGLASSSLPNYTLFHATTLNRSPAVGSATTSPSSMPSAEYRREEFDLAKHWWLAPFALISSAVGFTMSAFSGGMDPAHGPMSSSANRPRERSKSALDRTFNVAPLFVGAGGAGFVAASFRGAGISGAWGTVGIGAGGGAAEGLSEAGFQDLRRGQVSDASEYASKTFGGFLGGGVAAGVGYGAFVGLPGVIRRHKANWSSFNEAFSKDVAEPVTFDVTLPMERKDWRKVVLLNEQFQMSNADDLMRAQGYIPLQSHFKNNTGIDRVYTNFSCSEVITCEFKTITGFQPAAIMEALASRNKGWGGLQGSSEYNVAQAMRYLNSEKATPEMRETGRLILRTPQHARELWISDEFGRVRSFDLTFWEMLDPRW